jgi:hypothetical protein
MKKIIIMLVLIFGLFGFKPNPNRCAGTILVTLTYPWTDTTYLYVEMENTGKEKKIFYVPSAGYTPQVLDRIVFDCNNIIE